MEGQLTIYQWNGFFVYSLGSTSSAIGLEGMKPPNHLVCIVKEAVNRLVDRFFSAVYQVSKPAYGTAPSHRCRLQNLLLLAPFSRRDKPISHPYKQSAAKDVPQRDRHHVADPSTNGNGLGMPR